MGVLKKIAEKTALEAAEAAGKSVAKRMSKAELEAAGFYHPVGAGVKLKKPISEMTFETIDDPRFNPVPIKLMTPEDLYGKVGVPLIGDRAEAGKILKSIEGEAVDVPLEGGRHYMRSHTYPTQPEKSAAWASDKAVSTKLSKAIRRGAEESDDVYGINIAGSPTNVDFNTMLSSALVQRFDPSKVKLKDILDFNREVKEVHPEFFGIDHPDVLEQLNKPGAGNLRKHFADRMATAKYQNAGFPDFASSVKAITDPELLDVPTGSAGLAIAKMEPTGRIIEEPLHEHGTYKAPLAGEYAGEFQVPLDFRDIFQSAAEQRRLLGLPVQSDLRSLSFQSPAVQRFDQEWLDKVMPVYEKKLKEITGKKEGGEVNLKDKMKLDDLVEEPRGKISGAIADVLKPASDFLSQYEIKDYVPLLGGTDIAELTGVKGAQTLAEDISRGYNPIRGGSLQTTTFDPRLVDAAGLIPGVGQLAKLGKNLGKTAIEQAGKNIVEGRMPGVINPRMNIIKDPGGMVVGAEKELDRQLTDMYKNESIDNYDGTYGHDHNAAALNNWVNTKVRKYIRNQAGTESDPILKAIESGVEHNFSPAIGDTKYYVKNKRALVGKPEEGIAKTDLGKEWEYKVDSTFTPKKSADIKEILNNPMGFVDPAVADRRRSSLLRIEHDLPIHDEKDLEALKLINHIPDENIYTIDVSNLTNRLGLNHVGDVLYEDLQSGRLRPEQLDQMSIEKAVRRAAEYDAQKAKEMTKAHATSVEGMPIPKQYDDGFKWVELKHPEDPKKTAEALKSEGEMMGHCVGSYCPQVESGATKIYSLRGPDNKSHVTVEATKHSHLNSWLEANKTEIENDPLLKQMAYSEPDMENYYSKEEEDADRIAEITKFLKMKGAPVHEDPNAWIELQQIKGKQNKRPDDKYQKYVTDFITNNPTGHEIVDIHELDNTSLLNPERILSTGLVSKNVHFHPDVEKVMDIMHPEDKHALKKAFEIKDIEKQLDKQQENKYEFFKQVVRDMATKGKRYFTEEDFLNHIRDAYLPKKKLGGPITKKDLEIQMKLDDIIDLPQLRRRYG